MAKNQTKRVENKVVEKAEKPIRDIVVVKFLKSFTPYIKDEVAGFDKKFANKLIDKEVAEEFTK